MTPDQLTHLKKLCEAATPGPWKAGQTEPKWLTYVVTNEKEPRNALRKELAT